MSTTVSTQDDQKQPLAWDPAVYNQFKGIRYQPFYDLSALLRNTDEKNTQEGPNTNTNTPRPQCVDIGCGTGEQTSILSSRFPDWDFVGVDSSPSMLKDSDQLAAKCPNLAFKQSSTEALIAAKCHYDVIFSNAALQWSNDHHELFPALIDLVKPNGGQFAVQMPNQTDNILNVLLVSLAQEAPFCDYLDNFVRHSPVLKLDEYATIMFKGGLSDLVVFQKIYPIISNDVDTLFNFISGSALIPYMDRLSTTTMVDDDLNPNQQISHQDLFVREYKSRIKQHFKEFPAIYAFKRTLMYGRKL